MDAMDLEQRLSDLERSVRRTRLVAGGLAFTLIALAVAAFRSPEKTLAEVRTRRLVVLDDSGRARVTIGQDPITTQRQSRSVALLLFDRTGAERGGFGVTDEGAVGIGLDAPVGVGTSPTRDRIGVLVAPDGTAQVTILDNTAHAVASLRANGRGDGGVQVFKRDASHQRLYTRTLTYDGDMRDSTGMSR
jgi:hypothetical protein